MAQRKKIAEKKRDREFCRILYVHEMKEVDEIVAITGISKSNIYFWKNEEDWEHQRSLAKLNPRFLAGRLEKSIQDILDSTKAAIEFDSYEDFCKAMRSARRREKFWEKISKGIITPAQADAIHKLNNTKMAMLKESNYMSISFDVMNRFQKYLKANEPKLLKDALVNAIHDFLKQLFDEV